MLMVNLFSSHKFLYCFNNFHSSSVTFSICSVPFFFAHYSTFFLVHLHRNFLLLFFTILGDFSLSCLVFLFQLCFYCLIGNYNYVIHLLKMAEYALGRCMDYTATPPIILFYIPKNTVCTSTILLSIPGTIFIKDSIYQGIFNQEWSVHFKYFQNSIFIPLSCPI